MIQQLLESSNILVLGQQYFCTGEVNSFLICLYLRAWAVSDHSCVDEFINLSASSYAENMFTEDISA
jgi:hypothetical protein